MCDDLLDLAVATPRLLTVNYIKGSSHRVNDILLSSNRVNTNPLRVYVRVVSED